MTRKVALFSLSLVLVLDLSVDAIRQLMFDSLVNIDDTVSAVQGIVSPMYFEASRNILRAPRFGVYQNGWIVSANTQYEPIEVPGEIKDIELQMSNLDQLEYAVRHCVVHAGQHILEGFAPAFEGKHFLLGEHRAHGADFDRLVCFQ